MSFSDFAQATSQVCGRSYAFGLACIVIVVWAATGPVFHYSDSWQLIINTGTTIVTFLMVFLIQNTQSRDTTSIKVQLAELIRANEQAHNRLASLEDLTEDQLKMLAARYAALAQRPEPHDKPL
jgi:low affinity Fe/Cu permease